MKHNHAFEDISKNRRKELEFICKQYSETTREKSKLKRYIDTLGEIEPRGYDLRRYSFLCDRIEDIEDSLDDVLKHECSIKDDYELSVLRRALFSHICKGQTFNYIDQFSKDSIPVSEKTFFKLVRIFYCFLDLRCGQKVTIC